MLRFKRVRILIKSTFFTTSAEIEGQCLLLCLMSSTEQSLLTFMEIEVTRRRELRKREICTNALWNYSIFSLSQCPIQIDHCDTVAQGWVKMKTRFAWTRSGTSLRGANKAFRCEIIPVLLLSQQLVNQCTVNVHNGITRELWLVLSPYGFGHIHNSSMTYPQYIHDISTIYPWYIHNISTIYPWYIHDTSIIWHWTYPSLVLPWTPKTNSKVIFFCCPLMLPKLFLYTSISSHLRRNNFTKKRCESVTIVHQPPKILITRRRGVGETEGVGEAGGHWQG